jgi:hypothetical protein
MIAINIYVYWRCLLCYLVLIHQLHFMLLVVL